MITRQLRIAGALMITAAVLANIGFTVLGSTFNYPDVLDESATKILNEFHADAGTIAALFAVLALASAALIPIAWFCRHLIAADRTRTRRLMVAAGIAAGVVQVIGLMRWPLLVPHYADIVTNPATSAVARADAIDTFKTLHTVLGGVIGEVFGYALTATWTIAMVTGVARRPGRWFAPLGITSAVLIATGVLEEFVSGFGLTNFVGYVAWSIWMIAFGISILRHAVEANIATKVTVSRVPELAR